MITRKGGKRFKKTKNTQEYRAYHTHAELVLKHMHNLGLGYLRQEIGPIFGVFICDDCKENNSFIHIPHCFYINVITVITVNIIFDFNSNAKKVTMCA